MNYVSDLSTPLLNLSAADPFRLVDATSGVAVLGATGSGKTSGTGKALASAYLRAGFGFLVLCAKPDEVDRWVAYARANGRENSVIIFGDRGGGGFNFITYELARQGVDGLGSVVECLMRIVDAARNCGPNPGGGGDVFWEDAMRQLLRNTLPILYAATGKVEIPDIIRFVATAPVGREQMHNADWQSRSFMFRMLEKAAVAPARAIPAHEFDKAERYWTDEYGQLDNRTRSNISISLSTALDRFNRGRLNRHFCGETTLVPEMTFHGAIILLDMPALSWNEDGIVAQKLVKFMWQRAVLSRNALEMRHRDRPVVLWADEAHLFADSSTDADFLSTCRSSKACTVFMSQSLPTFYAKIGGANPKHKADMLLGNLATKVFHSLADHETALWAAESIGKTIQRRGNYSEGQNHGSSHGMNTGEGTNWGVNSSVSISNDGKGNQSTSISSGSSSGLNENWGRNRGFNTGESVSQGYSEVVDYEIQPGDFARVLKTGGAANGNEVSAVWFQSGRLFSVSGRNYLLTRFLQ